MNSFSSTGPLTRSTMERLRAPEEQLRRPSPHGPAPTLRNVKLIDLQCFSRTEELYKQAIKKQLIEPSDAARLNWFAAAIHAKSVDKEKGDPVRIFMGIVRRRLWHHITQSDEDRARRAINHYRPLTPAQPFPHAP